MQNERLKFKEKVAYGLGDAASSMFWKLFTAYLPFFYTNVFGITASAVGTLVAVVRTFDAAYDPFVGIVADRTTTRWGKFRPYLLWVAVPFAIFGTLMFTTPSLAASGKLVYAYASYIVMFLVYSTINVPYGALMGVMTADGKERTALGTYRFFFAFGGSLVVLAAAEPLAKHFGNNGANPQLGWQLMAGTFGIIAMILFFFTFLGTKERLQPTQEKTSLKDDLADLGRNFPWFVLLGASIATIFFNSLRDGVTKYYLLYCLGGDKGLTILGISFTWTSLCLVAGQAANIIGVLLAKPVSDRIGKKNTFMMAMVLAAVFSVGFDWLTQDQMVLVFLLQVLVSINAGIIFPLLWPMYADAADYSEWKRGRRSTGLVFSASSMSQKFGGSLGGAAVGWLLAYYVFDAKLDVQSTGTQSGIRMMMSIYPAIGALASAACMLIYPLRQATMDKIEGELAARRTQKNPAPAAS